MFLCDCSFVYQTKQNHVPWPKFTQQPHDKKDDNFIYNFNFRFIDLIHHKLLMALTVADDWSLTGTVK